MSSSSIQFLVLAIVLVALAGLTLATSYDKYDPGYGIYDDGFSHNDYGLYRTSSKYAVKHGYRGAVPMLSRPPKPGRIAAYGHAPSPHYTGFY